MQKLTKRMLDIHSAPEKGQIFLWDDELIGFGLQDNSRLEVVRC